MRKGGIQSGQLAVRPAGLAVLLVLVLELWNTGLCSGAVTEFTLDKLSIANFTAGDRSSFQAPEPSPEPVHLCFSDPSSESF